jgi:hypothetical protein
MIQSRWRAVANSSRSGMSAEFITKLPKAEHDAPEWQAAMEALLLVAERGGPTMFARNGSLANSLLSAFPSRQRVDRREGDNCNHDRQSDSFLHLQPPKEFAINPDSPEGTSKEITNII